jgi:hypothetical protein
LEQLLQLFGPDSRLFSYAAAHLRLGGLGHECGLRRDRGTGRGELADTIAALTCARRLGQQAGMEVAANSSVAGDLKAPVLLITDQHMLRSFVLSGGLVSAAAVGVVWSVVQLSLVCPLWLLSL